MKWNNKDIKPEKEGWYLCCGDLIQWNMKDGDPPDTFFLCYFSDGWGREILSGLYDEVTFMFWMELPEFPFNNQPERSKREDYKVTTINSYSCPKIEMPIDKDILTKYKWDSIDAVL